MALDDDQPLSGAQFARQVGTDPEKWAARFLAVYTEAEGLRTDADRLAFVTAWFADAMEAAVKAAGRRAQRDERDFLKDGIWKPGDALDDEGRTASNAGPAAVTAALSE